MTTTLQRETIFEKILDFLKAIGIVVKEGAISDKSFLPGILIKNGELIIDTHQLQYPGDILHEAGHIAIAPPADRVILNDNVTANRPGTEGEEMCVLLWSYAACLHLSIPPEFVFHAEGYKGESEWLLTNFRSGTYIGLPLLVWMGMASNPDGQNGFPQMRKWLRE